MTSYNPNDIREGYCGNCHDWTGEPVCKATSWPETVNDSRCVKMASHKDKHRDIDGYEWGGNE